MRQTRAVREGARGKETKNAWLRKGRNHVVRKVSESLFESLLRMFRQPVQEAIQGDVAWGGGVLEFIGQGRREETWRN